MWYKDGTLYVGYWSMGLKEGLGMFVQGKDDLVNLGVSLPDVSNETRTWRFRLGVFLRP